MTVGAGSVFKTKQMLPGKPCESVARVYLTEICAQQMYLLCDKMGDPYV